MGDATAHPLSGLVLRCALLSVLQHLLCSILELLLPGAKAVREGVFLLQRDRYSLLLHFICDKGAEHPPAAGDGRWLFWNEVLRFSW